MSFGNNISDYRNRIGMAQSELAKQSGLTLNKLIKIESNMSFPDNISVVKNIAAALGVNENTIFEYTDRLVMEANGKGSIKKLRQLNDVLFKAAHDVPPMVDDGDKKLFLQALESAFWTSVNGAKKRYTPHKYRKPELSQ